MNEEELEYLEYIEHEIVDRLYCLEEKDFDKTKVEDSYIQAVLKAGKENKNLIHKLQKETERLEDIIIDYKYEMTRDEEDIDKLQKENEHLKDIKNKAIEYIEENSFEDTTGVTLNLSDENYWKVLKLLKGDN